MDWADVRCGAGLDYSSKGVWRALGRKTESKGPCSELAQHTAPWELRPEAPDLLFPCYSCLAERVGSRVFDGGEPVGGMEQVGPAELRETSGQGARQVDTS